MLGIAALGQFALGQLPSQRVQAPPHGIGGGGTIRGYAYSHKEIEDLARELAEARRAAAALANASKGGKAKAARAALDAIADASAELRQADDLAQVAHIAASVARVTRSLEAAASAHRVTAAINHAKAAESAARQVARDIAHWRQDEDEAEMLLLLS